MAGKLSPRATARMAALDAFAKKVHHLHGLVEQFASAAKYGKEAQYSIPLRRGFGDLKVTFTGAGMDALAQLAGSMEIAAGRGGSATRKLRILRDGVGSMRHQIELEQRALLREGQEKRAE